MAKETTYHVSCYKAQTSILKKKKEILVGVKNYTVYDKAYNKSKNLCKIYIEKNNLVNMLK